MKNNKSKVLGALKAIAKIPGKVAGKFVQAQRRVDNYNKAKDNTTRLGAETLKEKAISDKAYMKKSSFTTK